MCTTSAIRPQPSLLRKRSNDGSEHRRPVKRVSFSKRDNVLGKAQDYDRRSFEVPLMLRRRRTSRTLSQPQQRTPSTPAAAAAAAAAADESDKPQLANFSGMWRRTHGFHWASLLLFSGVDKAAVADQAARMQSSSVVHLIDHDATSFRLVVHSDSGHTQDQHFFIGGQPRPSPTTPTTNNTSSSSPTPTAKPTVTLSHMRWEKNGQALVLSSIDAATGDEMKVSRHLASQGTVIVQHYTARRAKTGETAEAISIFRKMVRGGDRSGSE